MNGNENITSPQLVKMGIKYDILEMVNIVNQLIDSLFSSESENAKKVTNAKINELQKKISKLCCDLGSVSNVEFLKAFFQTLAQFSMYASQNVSSLDGNHNVTLNLGCNVVLISFADLSEKDQKESIEIIRGIADATGWEINISPNTFEACLHSTKTFE